MQQWEYLEVYANTYFGNWVDSPGRSGKLTTVQPEGWKSYLRWVGPLLSRLGDEGWEVVARYKAEDPGTGSGRILLKRPK